jgi:hypothetical protein
MPNNTFHVIQRFDWISEDKETEIHFMVTDLLDDMNSGAVAFERLQAPIDPDWAAAWLIKRDLYLSRILAIRNIPALYQEPLLGVTMPNNTVLLIDGSHRYMARLLEGETMNFWHIVHHEDITDFYTVIKGTFP